MRADAELIDRIDFFPGNFGVSYGRVTGGHRRRRHQERHRRRACTGTSTSTCSHSSAYVEGPLADGWTGSISARRSYIDLLLPLVLPDNVTTAAPVYWDYQAGVNRELPGGRAVAVRVRQQRHAQGDLHRSARRATSISGWRSAFTGCSAIWTQALGGWTNQLSPAYGYERLSFGAGVFAINESAHVLSLRDELAAAAGRRVSRCGSGSTASCALDSIFFNLPAGAGDPPLRPDRADDRAAHASRSTPRRPRVYADATWDVGGGVTAIPGIRGDAFRYVGQNRFTFDPRLVVRWKMSPVHTWKAGAGIFHQMVDPQLLNPQLGNPHLPPIWADQYSVGFVRTAAREADPGHDALLRAPPRPAGPAAAVHLRWARALVRHGADPEARLHGALLRLDLLHAVALGADRLRRSTRR